MISLDVKWLCYEVLLRLQLQSTDCAHMIEPHALTFHYSQKPEKSRNWNWATLDPTTDSRCGEWLQSKISPSAVQILIAVTAPPPRITSWAVEAEAKLHRSENTGKFSLCNLAALTNSIYCNSQHGALMNRFSVMMAPIGWREFPTIFWSDFCVTVKFPCVCGLATSI